MSRHGPLIFNEMDYQMELYTLITPEEYEAAEGNKAHYLYFMLENALVLVTGKSLNNDMKERMTLISDAVSHLGYLDDDETNVYFKTTQPLLANADLNSENYIWISLTDESVLALVQSQF